ncbi:MAG: transcription termination/antitermination protein NusG [Lachnospiraceae bacterium]|nr:transcription termination/antitermination factor NusG [Lachnospiraceae bacterium]MCR5023160.1 transcription termination/antitermination protein NusG [Lachnospiraceae bacterium]
MAEELKDELMDKAVEAPETSEVTEEKEAEETEKKIPDNAHWYVVHTYSGYENKVKTDLDKTIENRHLEDLILEVRIPTQMVSEVNSKGQRKTAERKMFPGYVLVHMVKTNDTWYVVRNTRGVTGFVGPGSEPIPLTEEEMKPLGIHVENMVVDFGVGDTVAVVAGVWKDTVGEITRMDMNKKTATITVELFGRGTSVEISFDEISKMR